MSTHPSATPDEMRRAIVTSRERVRLPGDPDGIAEGVLDVSGF
jgi:hypothetical protein